MVSDGCPTINIGEVAPLLSIVLSVCLATPTITNQSEILTPFQTQYKASLKILSSRVLKLCLKKMYTLEYEKRVSRPKLTYWIILAILFVFLIITVSVLIVFKTLSIQRTTLNAQNDKTSTVVPELTSNSPGLFSYKMSLFKKKVCNSVNMNIFSCRSNNCDKFFCKF